ncbi:MAG: hypothetical protein Q4C52_12000 [Eubacteriales bacterium]|nr:hypothetical protein [Eubacteriales bacterium]
MNETRVGRVSKINYENGTIEVLYTDRDNEVTTELPVLNFGNEYHMPKIDDMVMVMHLSNGCEMGVVLGTFWCGGNPPPESGEGLYRKEYGSEPGEAYARFKNGIMEFKADSVVFKTKSGTVSIREIVSHLTHPLD